MDGQVSKDRSDAGDSVQDSWLYLGFASEEDMLDWLENQQLARNYSSDYPRKAASVLRFGLLCAGLLVLWRSFSPRA